MKKLIVLLLIALVHTGSSLFAAEPIEWNANWIWIDGHTSPKNFFMYARKTVELPAGVEEAAAHISADSRDLQNSMSFRTR